MTSTMSTIAAVAFVFSLISTAAALAVALRFGIVDTPNHRSSHSRPTARAGGVALLLSAGLAVSINAPPRGLPPSLFVGAAAIAAIGLIDDIRGVRASIRLCVHLAAAVGATLGGGLVIRDVDPLVIQPVLLGAAAIPLTVLWLVGATNAYNFMDGINGIASLQAVAAGGGLAALFLQRRDVGGAAVAVALAGAAAGFLPWNFPKARIFMGDVASGTLGFLFGVLVVRAVVDGESFFSASLVLLPFWADAGVTLIRRALRRERIFEAHRTHFYQRLIRLRWPHAAVSTVWFFLAVCAAAVAVACSRLDAQLRLVLVSALFIVHVTVAAGITLAERRRDSHGG
jgi:UDP-N-acetylmuramyl pentapeptide phosphotransferase/UDP-N-acetylglucosamine-1-phosphate transferase